MRWLSKIPFVILGLLILLACGRIFFFPGDREVTQSNTSYNEVETITTDPSIEQGSAEATLPEEVESETTPTTTQNPTKKVTPEICEQECEGFSTIPAEQSYCLTFCGLNQEGYLGKDCGTLASTERDACFKEQAIREHNPETCARIGESSLRRVCEARVAEELFD